MIVIANKLTDTELMRLACSFTSGAESKMTLDKIYQCEHGPIYTQLFWVQMVDIPTFVSVHLVRHHVGVSHYVRSNRDDRGGDIEADRNTPIDHAMLINAKGLIDMSRKRLCLKAHIKTVYTMHKIKDAIELVDPDLAKYMVPECEYRGKCYELKPCKRWTDAN